jgi:hypothetical protein
MRWRWHAGGVVEGEKEPKVRKRILGVRRGKEKGSREGERDSSGEGKGRVRGDEPQLQPHATRAWPSWQES